MILTALRVASRCAVFHVFSRSLVRKVLNYLDKDIPEHPERLRRVDMSMVQRARELVADVEIDLEAPLIPDETDAIEEDLVSLVNRWCSSQTL